MRILIADDSMVTAKALRPLLERISKRGLAKAIAKGAPAAGKLVVSCAPRKLRKRAEECACSGLDLGDQPEQAATILDAIGMALLNRGCLEEGGALVELALKIRRKFFGDDHPATASSRDSLARLERERGNYDEAEASAREALRINRTVFGANGLPVAISLRELGFVQLQQGRFSAAEDSAKEGLRILDALCLTLSDPNTTRLMDVRGRAEHGLGRLHDAAATYEALLKIDLRQLRTKNHPKYATHLANFALVQEALRKRSAAERAYRNAIELYGKTLNRPCHPNLIDALANLGSLLRTPPATAAQLEEAGRVLLEALRLDTILRGDSHALVGNDYANLGRWLYDVKRVREAYRSFAKALGIYERNVRKGVLPADHYFIAEALTWLGRLLVEQGTASAAAKAETMLDRATAIWPAQVAPGSLGEGVAKACLGRALFLQGKNPIQACNLLCEGFKIVAPNAPDTALIERIKGWIDAQGCECGGVNVQAS
jgi:tetratricopeptide (TPR) repeat protein